MHCLTWKFTVDMSDLRRCSNSLYQTVHLTLVRENLCIQNPLRSKGLGDHRPGGGSRWWSMYCPYCKHYFGVVGFCSSLFQFLCCCFFKKTNIVCSLFSFHPQTNDTGTMPRFALTTEQLKFGGILCEVFRWCLLIVHNWFPHLHSIIKKCNKCCRHGLSLS